MIDAVIFDMDGVISDTQKFHARIESELLSRFNIKLTPGEITKKYAGVATKKFFIELLDPTGIDYDINALMLEKWEKMKAAADKEVVEVPGASDLIKSLNKQKLTLAVATSSNWKYARAVLEKLELIRYFRAIITIDMVNKGKPDPEIFLFTAEKINKKPEECVVIEDGRSGMEAAITGGFKCIGLVDNIEEEYPTKNLVTSLSEITPGYINNLK